MQPWGKGRRKMNKGFVLGELFSCLLRVFLHCPSRELWVVLIGILGFSQGHSFHIPRNWTAQVYPSHALSPMPGEGFTSQAEDRKVGKKPHAAGVYSLNLICKIYTVELYQHRILTPLERTVLQEKSLSSHKFQNYFSLHCNEFATGRG